MDEMEEIPTLDTAQEQPTEAKAANRRRNTGFQASSGNEKTVEEMELKSALASVRQQAAPGRRKGFIKFSEDTKSATDLEESDAEASMSESATSSKRLEESASGDESVERTRLSSIDLGQSIRERIRTKFKSVVEKAEKQERFKRRLSQLQLQRSVQAETGIQDRADSDQFIEDALQKSMVLRQRRIESQPKPKIILPSAQEQYDFFTAVYEKPQAEPKPAVKKVKFAGPEAVVAGEIEPAEEAEAKEEPRHLAGFADREYPTEMKAAVTVPHLRQLRKENEIYFTPSFLPVSLKDKLGTRNERKLAEENLYTGKPFELPSRNVNLMEQRLLREPGGAEKWFNEDGTIRRSVASTAAFPSKPDIPERQIQLTHYHQPRIRRRNRIGDGDGMFQLDVDVSKILFTHHSLFSKENVLATRLLLQYESYLQRSEENLSSYYSYKLHGLKMSYDQIKESIQLSEQSGNAVERSVSETLERYLDEIIETRRLRNSEELLDRTLLKQIIATWRAIKLLRAQQSYTCTSVQLSLKKIELEDQTLDETQWNTDLEEEVNELQERYAKQYAVALSEFNEKLKTIEANKKKLPKKKARLPPAGDNPAEPVDDVPTSDEVESTPPVKPSEFDRQAAWEGAKQAALTTRRTPGEPILIPVIGSTAPVTATTQCPVPEQKRREDIGKHRIYAKIYFNNIEACTTTARPLNADFCVSFGQVYNLHVFEWPNSIVLRIFENVGNDWWPLAEVGLPVPSVNQIAAGGVSTLEEFQFSSDLTQAYSHAGVGSGLPLNFEVAGLATVIPRTTGILQASALWGRAKDGSSMVPPIRMDASLEQRLKEISPKNIAALREIQELLSKAKFDPNDPVNSHLLALLQKLEQSAAESGDQRPIDGFRLAPQECALATEEDIKLNQRFRLLELRAKQVPEFRNFKMIPANAKDVPPEIFKAYEVRIATEQQKLNVTDMDGYRVAVNRYIKAVREEIVQRLQYSKHTRTFQDIVMEEPIHALGALGIVCCPVDFDRPLKPMRRERKKTVAQNISGLHVKVLINVVRASDIPLRKDQTDLSHPSGKERNTVAPFVEITFQGQTVRTSVLEGPNPTWNQQISLDFKAPGDDYSSSSLQTITDNIYINLFDQVIMDLPKDSREGATTVYQQIEKRWLGMYKIPFSTVYYNGRIFGSFRLQFPPLLLGYKSEAALADPEAKPPTPHLQLFLAIDPPLLPPEPIRAKQLESMESPELRSQAHYWLQWLETTFPQRRFLPLVIDTNGRTIFISRFLRPIRPPPEVERIYATNVVDAINLACRIVSMIPFVSDPVLFPGMCDIWSTCEQFLNMLCGDEEEHAVLLACWLLGLKLECLLLIGNGLPEGPRAAYVLVQVPPNSVPLLLNASTGISYSASDSFCPMTSVGCAVSETNVYANVQTAEHPCRLSFDVTNATKWYPFFTKSSPNPGLPSIQVESMKYAMPERASIDQLEAKIESAIKNRIMGWRRHILTRWDHEVSSIFKQLLPALEHNFLSLDHERTHNESLKSLMNAYKIVGFPLNAPFTTTEELIELIQATNVHQNFHSEVKFALAVYVHAYTNCIFSVWIYVAALIPNRQGLIS